jgi:hypothetical protein
VELKDWVTRLRGEYCRILSRLIPTDTLLRGYLYRYRSLLIRGCLLANDHSLNLPHFIYLVSKKKRDSNTRARVVRGKNIDTETADASAAPEASVAPHIRRS